MSKNKIKATFNLLALICATSTILIILQNFLNTVFKQPQIIILNFFLMFCVLILIIIFLDIKKIIYYSNIFFQRLKNTSYVFEISYFNKNVTLLSLFLSIFFTISVINISNFDVLGENFNVPNQALTYTLYRLIFSISIFVAIFATGAFFNQIFNFSENNGKNRILKTFILNFSFGILIYSFLGVILGLLGFLHFSVTYFIVSLILLFSGKVLNISRFILPSINQNKKLLDIDRIKFNLSIVVLIGSTSTLFFFKGIIPFETDGDIWGHYMHYFNFVKEQSQILPNEFWYHFHLSKGAGLFYFFISISDILTPQIISFFCIFLVAVIVIDIVFGLCKNPIWAMTAGILFLTSISIISPINLFKHHYLFMSLIMVMFWCLYEVLKSKILNKGLFKLLILTTFYIGFFYPTISLMIFIYLIAIGCSSFIFFRDKSLLLGLPFIILLIGVFSSLILNFFYTGIFEVVKINFFWSLANKEFFISKFGFAPIEWSQFANDDFHQRKDFFHWIKPFLQKNVWPFILYLPTVIFTIIMLIFVIIDKKNIKLNIFLFLFLIFSFIAIMFAYIFQQSSVTRIYIFLNAFFYLPLCILTPIYFLRQSSSKILNIFNDLFAIILFLPAFFSLSILALQYSNVINLLYIKKSSLAETYKLSIDNIDRKKFYNFAYEVREDIPKKKIMLLSSNGGPASFLPMPGIMGEPQITFGKKWDEINTLTNPHKIKMILKNYKINYFIIDISKELWGNIVISSIFQNHNLLKFFKIVKNKGNYYLLTWKKANDDTIKSTKFTSLVELKRSTIINSIFSKNFKSNYLNNDKDIEKFYKSLSIKKQECLQNHENKDLLDKLLIGYKEVNLFVDDIDLKIANIRKLTKKLILEKYGSMFWMDLDLAEIAPHRKIYLQNVENYFCK